MITAPDQTQGDETARMTRADAFGFACTRCSTCCRDKRIQVGPYEVARLARRLGCSTTDFAARWTVDGEATTLSQAETGACVFLGDSGCTIHADRPLVCRLYPLGRHLSQDGTEHFSLVPISMRPAGEITKAGTVAAFLRAQEAEPFTRAVDGYFAWLAAAYRQLDGRLDAPASFVDTIGEQSAALLDMDRAIARHERETQCAAPADLEARRELHLEILYRQLDGIEQETGRVEAHV
jgi:Fe-S-cluster containining protein